MFKKLILPLVALIIITGCSKNPSVSRDYQTSLINHIQIKKDINNVNLDRADNDFMSLEADFPASIYIKSDILALYLAHLQMKEYDLAKFYLNQYEKRFASSEEIPWCEYQKIKMDFFKYDHAYTNQKALLDLIKECKKYKVTFPNSTFLPEVNTIYIKALLTNQYLNDKIYKLYKKLGYKNATKYFHTKIPNNSIAPYVPWYKKLFYW